MIYFKWQHQASAIIIYAFRFLEKIYIYSKIHIYIFVIFEYMKKIDYEALAEKLTEEYPIEENQEIYSLYTPMKQHLMKVYKMSATTAHKFLVKVEERLGIHLMRDREMTNMKMLKLKKDDDVKRYSRCIYWYNKLPIELVDAILKKYNNINASIVKKFLFEKGQLTSEKFDKFTYAKKYYLEHKEELCRKKREYRQKKLLEKNK